MALNGRRAMEVQLPVSSTKYEKCSSKVCNEPEETRERQRPSLQRELTNQRSRWVSRFTGVHFTVSLCGCAEYS